MTLAIKESHHQRRLCIVELQLRCEEFSHDGELNQHEGNRQETQGMPGSHNTGKKYTKPLAIIPRMKDGFHIVDFENKFPGSGRDPGA